MLLANVKRLLSFSPVLGLREKLNSEIPALTLSSDPAFEGVDIRTDMVRLPFNDRSFDAIVCSHVLEHISDESTALSELRRVLHDHGWCLIMVPQNRGLDTTYEDDTITSSHGREKAFGQSNHVRWYGADFAGRIEAAGFNVRVIDYASKLDEKTVKTYGLVEKDEWIHDQTLLFYCQPIQ